MKMKKDQKLKDEIDILLVTDNGIETVGGEQESVKIIISGLKKKYRMGIIQPGNINNPIPGIHYFPLTEYTRIKHFVKNPFTFFGYIWKIRKIINTEKPKIIHTQAQVSFFIVALLKKLKFISSEIRLIHTERGLYIRYSAFFKKLFHSFIKELNVLITTTNFNMKSWRKPLIKYNDEVITKVIENTAGDIFETYDPYLEAEDIFTIGFAGRYSEQKNWPLAVEICEKLQSRIKNKFKVIMAIGCLDTNSEIKTKEMFNKMEKILGANFKGYINVNINKMNKIYYETDVFLLTALPNTESFGRTIVEAMSRKNAVLITDAGGPTEIVEKAENICYSSKEFVERILEFYLDTNLLKREKNLNLVRVKDKYSLNNNINKHKEIYNKIL